MLTDVSLSVYMFVHLGAFNFSIGNRLVVFYLMRSGDGKVPFEMFLPPVMLGQHISSKYLTDVAIDAWEVGVYYQGPKVFTFTERLVNRCRVRRLEFCFFLFCALLFVFIRVFCRLLLCPTHSAEHSLPPISSTQLVFVCHADLICSL